MNDELREGSKTAEASAGNKTHRWVFRSVARIRNGVWCWGCWANRKCQGDPLGFGTEATREAATSAAERYVRREHPHSKMRDDKPWKARWFYNEHIRQPATVMYSRCSAGKSKWFWCCWQLEDWHEGKCAFATGYSNTSDDAEVQAVTACKQHFPTDVYQWENANAAAHYRRRLIAEQKAARTTTTTNSQLLEFLYTHNWDGDGSYSHRIVKKTKKRVFVDAEIWTDRKRVFGDWRDFAWSKSYSLDREKVEREGCVWCRAARQFFYNLPWEERRQAHRVATVEEVKRQWRKRLFHAHPDQGGDTEEFKRVFAEYERAMAMAC